MKTFLSFFLIFLLTVTLCDAAGVILKWDAVQNPVLKGYKIYFGSTSTPPYNGTQSFQGKSPIKVPVRDLYDPKNPEYTLFGLKNDQTHYITVTAYSDDVESQYSNVVVFKPYDNDQSGFSPIRINAGGERYVDQSGNVWSSDYGYVKGYKTKKTGHAIKNTPDETLFQTGRQSGSRFSYQLDVPPGKYIVSCYFAEVKRIYFGVGKRVFNVMIEDEVVDRSFDMYSEAGPFTALVKSFEVTVADEQLDIDFISSVEKPTVCAIEINKIN